MWRRRTRRAGGHAWKLVYHALASFFGHRAQQLAASMAYYALFSIFPSAILLAAIFGALIDEQSAREGVVDFLADNLPVSATEGRNDIDDLLRGVTESAATLGLLALLGILYSASALIGSVRNALNTIWGIEDRRPPLRGKGLDILLVLGLGLLFGLSLGATVTINLLSELTDVLGDLGSGVEALVRWTGALVPIGLSAIVVTVLYRVIPAKVTRLADVWPGVLFATLGYELAKRGFTLYLENFADYSAVYGSLGAVIAFMVFVYIGAIVILLGAEMAAIWPQVRDGELDEPGDGEEESLGQRVVGALRSLVFYDSDEDREPGDDG